MKPQRLTKQEESLLSTQDDLGDTVILEIIKGMSLEELCCFDVYKANSLKHYNTLQITWLNAEKHLISHRDGEYKQITEGELLKDLEEFKNPQRFRTFYVLKYPHMVTRVKW